MYVLAQNSALWEDVVRGMAGNGLWLFLSVLFLLWTLESVAKRFMKHRERIAMIDAGMNPADLDAVDGEQSCGGEAKSKLRTTVNINQSGNLKETG